MGLRPRVKRGRDADGLLTAIVSTGNGAFSAIYLLGVLDTAQAMRDTQNTEARRPISRTYEGVQWFKHTCPDHHVPLWVTPISGTPLVIVRRVPCALDDLHSCFLAVHRPHNHSPWVHHRSAWTGELTQLEREAVEGIDSIMPWWTVNMNGNIHLRAPRFDSVRKASLAVADLNRRIQQNVELGE